MTMSNLSNRDEPSAKLLQLQSTLTCPNCGHQEKVDIPLLAKKITHSCSNCNATSCSSDTDKSCVFCSYGDTACLQCQKVD